MSKSKWPSKSIKWQFFSNQKHLHILAILSINLITPHSVAYYQKDLLNPYSLAQLQAFTAWIQNMWLCAMLSTLFQYSFPKSAPLPCSSENRAHLKSGQDSVFLLSLFAFPIQHPLIKSFFPPLCGNNPCQDSNIFCFDKASSQFSVLISSKPEGVDTTYPSCLLTVFCFRHLEIPLFVIAMTGWNNWRRKLAHSY